MVSVADEPVLEQAVAESSEPESIIEPAAVNPAAISPEAAEPQQPAPEPVTTEPAAPAVPELPPISVDSMISNSMGNIFQKKVTKDPILKSLLDRHPDEDMQEQANDLREFAEDIGASDKSE
ncbi:MAG: hypothetical protein CL902_07885 [Dehalococcoidia bacterium]|nr:hypothetical protein [Dehalococcoidia bacterium]